MHIAPYSGYPSFGEGHSLEAAAQWVQGLLLGQLGTAIAVLAVAIAGINMLWGRLSVKEGARILFGCFILFGAPAIAQGIMGSVESTSVEISIPTPQPVTVNPPISVTPSPPANINPFDPYTGATRGN